MKIQKPGDIYQSSAEGFDKALKILLSTEAERPLLPHELVDKGQLILITSDEIEAKPEDALRAFETALTADPENVPALMEIGWFYHALESDSARAQPYFDRALSLLKEWVTEAISGRVACIEELSTEEEAREEYDRLVAAEALIVHEKLTPDIKEWIHKRDGSR